MASVSVRHDSINAAWDEQVDATDGCQKENVDNFWTRVSQAKETTLIQPAITEEETD